MIPVVSYATSQDEISIFLNAPNLRFWASRSPLTEKAEVFQRHCVRFFFFDMHSILWLGIRLGPIYSPIAQIRLHDQNMLCFAHGKIVLPEGEF